MFGASSENLGRRFLVADLVPAAVLCAIFILMSAPELQWLGDLNSLTWAERQLSRLGDKTVIVPSSIFIVAVIFNHLNRTLTRGFEGYLSRNLGFFGFTILIAVLVLSATQNIERAVVATGAFAGSALIALWIAQVLRKDAYVWEYEELEQRWKFETDIRQKFLIEHLLASKFPRDKERVLPTRFGNLYRAAEYYPRYMFNIDAITMWPRLLAVIPPDFKKAMEDAETNVAFAVNMCVVSLILALCSVYAGFHSGAATPWLVMSAWIVVAIAFYRSACVSVSGWAEYIRSAFDLYRLDLLKKLSIQWPSTAITNDAEEELWRKVQRVTFYNHKPEHDSDFVVEKPGDKGK